MGNASRSPQAWPCGSSRWADGKSGRRRGAPGRARESPHRQGDCGDSWRERNGVRLGRGRAATAAAPHRDSRYNVLGDRRDRRSHWSPVDQTLAGDAQQRLRSIHSPFFAVQQEPPGCHSLSWGARQDAVARLRMLAGPLGLATTVVDHRAPRSPRRVPRTNNYSSAPDPHCLHHRDVPAGGQTICLSTVQSQRDRSRPLRCSLRSRQPRTLPGDYRESGGCRVWVAFT